MNIERGNGISPVPSEPALTPPEANSIKNEAETHGFSAEERQEWGTEGLPQSFEKILGEAKEANLPDKREYFLDRITEKIGNPLFYDDKEVFLDFREDLRRQAPDVSDTAFSQYAAQKTENLLKENLTLEGYKRRLEVDAAKKKAEKEESEAKNKYRDIHSSVNIYIFGSTVDNKKAKAFIEILTTNRQRIDQALSEKNEQGNNMLYALCGLIEKSSPQKMVSRFLGRPAEAPVQELARSILIDHLSEIQDRILETDTFVPSLHALRLLIDCDNAEYSQQAFDVWQQTRNTIRKKLDPSYAGGAYGHLLTAILKRGNGEQTAVATDDLRQWFDSKNGLPIEESERILQPLLESNDKVIKEKGMAVLKTVIDEFNLDSEDLLRAWSVSDKKTQHESTIMRNFHKIIELENQQPGITQVLNKEFGIKTFARYNTKTLLQQYEQRNDIDRPYGVVMFPRSDWNGAFYQDDFTLEALSDQLAPSYAMRIIECESKIGVAKSLARMNKRYGGHQKISFAIIGGHGTKNSISFGGYDKQHQLLTSDLQGKGSGQAQKYFVEKPTIILVSCSTGTNKGIGQKLSHTLGARVIAPAVPTNVLSIEVVKERDSLVFKVEYREEGSLRTYRAGQPE